MIEEEQITVNSFFALALLRLQNRIEEKVPEIKWMDQDFGQMELPMDRPPVSFPCLLVDFGSTQYDQQHQDIQAGTVAIQFRLCFAPFSNSNFATPAVYRQQAIDYYDIEMKLYRALQGYDCEDIMQPLTRISAASEEREDTYRVRVITFTTWFEDRSFADEKVTVSRPPLEIDNEFPG